MFFLALRLGYPLDFVGLYSVDDDNMLMSGLSSYNGNNSTQDLFAFSVGQRSLADKVAGMTGPKMNDGRVLEVVEVELWVRMDCYWDDVDKV